MPDALLAHARAKLNLSLEITGKRADGFHLLRSIMQSVTACDTLRLRRIDGNHFTLACRDAALAGERNTVWHAAQLFFDTVHPCGGAALDLEKCLPYEAGLGSASADAAAALLGLNVLFGEPLEQEKLAELGLCVGSDVPFCLTGGTQWAEGVGERLTPLPALASCSIVIVRPAEGMRTPEAFARYDALTSPPTQPNSDALRQALKDGSLGAVAAHCGNALEASCPVAEVAVLKAALRAAGALGASMTGSGTAVFGLFSMEEEARAAASALAGSGRIILCTRPAKRGVVLQPLV